MALGRPRKGQERGGRTPSVTFRLEPEVLAKMDAIAEYHARQTGKREVSRADVIRLSVQREFERVTVAREGK